LVERMPLRLLTASDADCGCNPAEGGETYEQEEEEEELLQEVRDDRQV